MGSRGGSIVGGALAVCCVLAAGVPAAAAADPPAATLRAVGDGVAFVTPDAATVTISVTRTAASSGLARARENARLVAILAGLRGTGLPPGDVQSTEISLARQTFGPPLRGRRRPLRWVASGTLTVDTMRVDLLSRIFAAASGAGADGFDGPSYRLSDPAAGELAAEAAAVRNARARADNAAAAAGMRVTGVQSIDLDPGSPTLPAQSAPAAVGQAKAAPTPVPTPTRPGRQEVDATVDAVFLIGPA